MAAKGYTLKEIFEYLKNIQTSLGTIGVSMSAISLPGSEKMLFNLEDDVYSLGLGIHGEMGVLKEQMSQAKNIVATMFEHMTAEKNPVRIDIDNSRLAVIINNLGGLSNIELTVFANEVVKYLKRNPKIVLQRIYIGSFMTSLNMNGATISLLKLMNDDQLKYLDYKTTATGWKNQHFGGLNDNFELHYNVTEKNYNDEKCTISPNMEIQLK